MNLSYNWRKFYFHQSTSQLFHTILIQQYLTLNNIKLFTKVVPWQQFIHFYISFWLSFDSYSYWYCSTWRKHRIRKYSRKWFNNLNTNWLRPELSILAFLDHYFWCNYSFSNPLHWIVAFLGMENTLKARYVFSMKRKMWRSEGMWIQDSNLVF